MSELLQLILVVILGSVVALVGGVLFLFKKSWTEFLEKHSISFGAGVLITVALVGLLPEAIEVAGRDAYIVVVLSFFAAYFFEHVLFDLHHHHDDHGHKHSHSKNLPVGLVLVGDTLHNFIDGVAIAATFMVAPGLGLITAISTLLHELPHEIADFGILLKAGWKKIDVLVVNLLSALASVLGAVLLYAWPGGESILGILLAVAAGLFLYLGASDFLPSVEVEEGNKIATVVPLALGIVVMLFTLKAVPHEHEHTDEYQQEKGVEYEATGGSDEVYVQ